MTDEQTGGETSVFEVRACPFFLNQNRFSCHFFFVVWKGERKKGRVAGKV